MNRYLLDTNHLSAYLDRQPQIEQRIDASLQAGHRFGICLPVLCEYRSGIRAGTRFKCDQRGCKARCPSCESGPSTNKLL